jgi:two-component system chemotaxis response regulator CheY
MKNILVLDDNKDILSALSVELHSCLTDCTIMTALNGEKGEAILRSMPIDLIVTELDMPVVNGYRFIELVKKKYPSVPVCVMSGDCSARSLEKLRAMGVIRWIQKPFPFEKLAQMITEELDKRPHYAM